MPTDHRSFLTLVFPRITFELRVCGHRLSRLKAESGKSLVPRSVNVNAIVTPTHKSHPLTTTYHYRFFVSMGQSSWTSGPGTTREAHLQ